MIEELFLICALALPSVHHTRPSIVSYHMVKSEQEQIKDLENWLKKKNPGIEVFIHKTPQSDKLKEYGWERFPANIFDHQIWIRRKPANDKKPRMNRRVQEAA